MSDQLIKREIGQIENGESDRHVVPEKAGNSARGKVTRQAQRVGETPTARRSWESVETKLTRVAQKARSEPKCRFTSLFHMMNAELLRGCLARLRGDAAAGIDQVTKEMYERNLEANLAELVDRLHRMAYIPRDVRRRNIPKPGSDKLRPLGIPCLEDKIVQAGLARIRRKAE